MEMRTLSNRLKATLRGGGALLLCLCLTACSSSDDEENVEPQLQVSPVALSFDRDEGDAETLSLTCNTEWTATASADWLTVTPASGSGNASVVVMTNEENPEPEMRSATVTVTAGGLKKTVNVTQDAGANLSVTPTETTLSAEEGSTATFDIATDVEWRIGSGPDWLSLSTRYGNGNGTVTITATQANDTEEDRTATLTVKAGRRTAEVRVTQKSFRNSISMAEKSEIVLSSGWEIVFEFASLVDGYYYLRLTPEEFDGLTEQELQTRVILRGKDVATKNNVVYSDNESAETESVVCCLPYSTFTGTTTYGEMYVRRIKTKPTNCDWDARVRINYNSTQSRWEADINMEPACDKYYEVIYVGSSAINFNEYSDLEVAEVIKALIDSGDITANNASGSYYINQTASDYACFWATWGVNRDGEFSGNIARDFDTHYGWAKPHKAAKSTESGSTGAKASVEAKLAELKQYLRVVRMK